MKSTSIEIGIEEVLVSLIRQVAQITHLSYKKASFVLFKGFYLNVDVTCSARLFQ